MGCNSVSEAPSRLEIACLNSGIVWMQRRMPSLLNCDPEGVATGLGRCGNCGGRCPDC
jgi:hypothetical protein